MADTQVRKSYCRTCQAFCGVEVEVADGRLVRIRGDSADPVSHGFVCSKGLQAPELHHGEGRLLHPLKRAGEGGWEPIASETALAEIGARLGEILQAHGPDAVAVYGGTQSLFDAVTPLATRGFAAALGVSYYGTMTIDQSAKWLAEARCGTFGGGPQPFDTADVWMLVGSNPLVSMVAAGGPTQFGFHDPVRALRRARARGLKLIVVDPRGSETARQADLFLQ
ncbi:MAG: molybdopterin oxidoreductase, partial [Phenylobacterium sp.]|nr:molybdopterin oxidoreductase [Phenylobacterium sp.]